MIARSLIYFACLAVLLVNTERLAHAQRVQFPTTTGVAQLSQPGSYAPPSPSAAPGSTYAAPGGTYAAPGATSTSPFTTNPNSYGTAGPPPTFDPYAAGGGAAPATSPYGGTPQPAVPVQQAPVYPNGANPPFDWQQGSYGFQGGDGVTIQAQRLFQDLGAEHTWIYGDSGDPNDFQINRSEFYTTMAIPSPYLLNAPLLVTPGFAANFLQGPIGDPMPADPDGPGPLPAPPRGPDLPPRLYDAYLDLAWFPQFTPQFGAELGVRSGVWTDFNHLDSDSVRLLGRGLAKLSLTPQMDILFGAVYLDRVDVKWLPAGGVYWRPTPEWDLYLVFPNPKVRKRFSTIGTTEWYYYFAGEYGGGSWTVDRVGTSDRIDINDLRASFGLEWETQTQIRGHIEAGYVFEREVIFADTGMPPRFTPDDTFMIRGGVDF